MFVVLVCSENLSQNKKRTPCGKQTNIAKIRRAITRKSLVRLIDCAGTSSVVVPGVGSEITAGALNRNVNELVSGFSPIAIIV